MFDFVGISLLLRITKWVAMETMHFHTALISLLPMAIFPHEGGPNEQFGTLEKLSLVRGCNVGQSTCRCITFNSFTFTLINRSVPNYLPLLTPEAQSLDAKLYGL